MKLFMIPFLLLSFTLQAKVIDGTSAFDTYFIEDEQEQDSYTYVELAHDLEVTESMYETILELHDVERQYCSIHNLELKKLTSDLRESFFIVYTTSDSCDGGNSFGLVLNENLEKIGEISDSDIYLD